MALTQIIEIQTDFGTTILKSLDNSAQSNIDKNRLNNHRNSGGFGSLSIGHYNLNNEFTVPQQS